MLHLADNWLAIEVSQAHTFRRNDCKVAVG